MDSLQVIHSLECKIAENNKFYSSIVQTGKTSVGCIYTICMSSL